MISYSCPKCHAFLTAHDGDAGNKVACPSCAQRLQVPRPPPPVNKTVLGTLESESVHSTAETQEPGRPGGSRWYYARDGQKHGPVTFAQLEEMARNRRLSPADMLLREGASRWVAAIDFPALYPEVEPVTPSECPAPISRLINCSACGREIAKEAASCPGCGAPNNWYHPEIVRFFQSLRRFRDLPPFQAQPVTRESLAGQTEPRQRFEHAAADWISSMGFFAPLNVSGLATLAVAEIAKQGITGWLRSQVYDDSEAFIVDFSGAFPVWQSTDDDYWYEVKRFFLRPRRGRQSEGGPSS